MTGLRGVPLDKNAGMPAGLPYDIDDIRRQLLFDQNGFQGLAQFGQNLRRQHWLHLTARQHIFRRILAEHASWPGSNSSSLAG